MTAPLFSDKLRQLTAQGLIAEDSRILFVNDGSRDRTWAIICQLAKQDPHFLGIAQSRNRGHQNAVLAGLMEAKNRCDVTISIDCDGQDDINAMDDMLRQYHAGYEVVYGVRSSRETDTFFKRFTAETFYRFLNVMGVEVVFNHADYRLISSKVLQEFADFGEVNLFLRGMIPLVGFPSTSVYYSRKERMAGESHYPLSKMLALALDGITSLSIRPIRLVLILGIALAFVSDHPVHPWICRARMGEHDLYHLLFRRDPASLTGHHRGVHRQNLSGGQAPPALHHQRADV